MYYMDMKFYYVSDLYLNTTNVLYLSLSTFMVIVLTFNYNPYSKQSRTPCHVLTHSPRLRTTPVRNVVDTS